MTIITRYIKAIDRHVPHLDALGIDKGRLLLELLWREDASGDGKPCGSGWISQRKKCSKKSLAKLTASLKAGDQGAISRVQSGKGKAAARQKLAREVARDKGKKAKDIPGVTPGYQEKLKALASVGAKPKRGIYSEKAESVIKKAKVIPPGELKRGAKVKLLEWERDNQDGTAGIYERDYQITSVKPGRITYKPVFANLGGQRPTNSVAISKDGTIAGGEFYPADSEPAKAFRLKSARKSEENLARLEKEADNSKSREAELSREKWSYKTGSQEWFDASRREQAVTSSRIGRRERIRAAIADIALGNKIAANIDDPLTIDGKPSKKSK